MDNEHVRVFDLPVECPNCKRPFIASVSLDTGVGHLIVPWHDDVRSVKTGPGAIGFLSRPAELPTYPDEPGTRAMLLLNMPAEGGKRFHLSVAANLGGACLGDPAKPAAFGLRKIHPGVYVFEPSLLVPNILHAFVVVTGVPDPAPWEKPL